MVLEGISSIPKLQELKIHLKAKIVGPAEEIERDIVELCAKMPQLKKINGLSLREARKGL